MPSKCCVPMCTSGYVFKNKISEKIPMFTTKDKKLQLQWSKAIPRKNYKVNDKSYVCAHHLTENDIKNGIYLQVGDETVFKEQRWSLKPNSIPTIFPNCPAHLSKGNKKAKLDCNDGSVSKKVKLDQQFATERSTTETADNIIQLETETEGEVTPNVDETFQFNARRRDNEVVDATMQLDTERDREEEFHIFKVEKDTGKLSIEKNVVLSNGNLSYEVKQASVPQNEETLPSLLTSIDMLKNIIDTFDKLELCGGISLVSHSQDVQEKLKLQQVTEGYEECNVWRSYSCR
ncbi:hypothetical protein OUZ56_018412 [Daphnia magna]|uniref:THAP-type domain-containing protein n=1 Tax=Daphnia magna TaxID=35525 RepID=A0ABQ9Z8U6_9CRUS|nr:hypothetical protein OUZ56_018412 [Daphnia magna]